MALPSRGSGVGWALSLYETLARDFHMSHHTILWELPLIRAFALVVAARTRDGILPPGPSYEDMDLIDRLRRLQQS